VPMSPGPGGPGGSLVASWVLPSQLLPVVGTVTVLIRFAIVCALWLLAPAGADHQQQHCFSRTAAAPVCRIDRPTRRTERRVVGLR
jgi:hypothetical protein